MWLLVLGIAMIALPSFAVTLLGESLVLAVMGAGCLCAIVGLWLVCRAPYRSNNGFLAVNAL